MYGRNGDLKTAPEKIAVSHPTKNTGFCEGKKWFALRILGPSNGRVNEPL